MFKTVVRLIFICALSFFIIHYSSFAILPIYAFSDKINYPNNKFGIHLTAVSRAELEDAAALVNSNGGDWGYVTLVIEENNRNREWWQNVFNDMRELHLIPIVRLATQYKNGCWERPATDEAKGWADFLDSLNWVIKNRYIVLFNEPNYSQEWGCRIDAADYFRVAEAFAAELKNRNSDYFIMLAGFNATAPHRLPEYESLENFFETLRHAELAFRFSAQNTPGVSSATKDTRGVSFGSPRVNELFANIDGWASHSYEYGIYNRELSLLRKMGITRKLPVFITETGWPHAEGVKYDRNFLPEARAARAAVNFLSSIVSDSQAVAVTPFILNYPAEPFDHFSWKKVGNDKGYYSQFYAVQRLFKTGGKPIQEEKIELVNKLPEKIISDSAYQIPIVIKNTGQGIWKKTDGYELALARETHGTYGTPGVSLGSPGVSDWVEYFFSDIDELRPGEQQTVMLHLKTGPKDGAYDFSFGIFENDKLVSNQIEWKIDIIPTLKIELKASLLFKKAADGISKLLVYNSKQEVVFEKNDLKIIDGKIMVDGVKNVTVGEKYRLVILKDGYLPRQTLVTIGEKDNLAVFETMLPLDFNRDGRLSIEDVLFFFHRTL